MVKSSHSLVDVSINCYYHGQAVHCGSMIERELLLVIHVQGKSIVRKSCIQENTLRCT